MVTIADVARRAGVSTSTVSYVLNGRTLVSDATRRRVQRSVAELGYHPNAGAKALAGRRHACDVLLITSDEGPEGVRRVAASGLADGVILMAVELDDPRTQVRREQGTQAALIGLPDDSRQLSCLNHDFAVAGGCARTTSATSATGTSPSSATAPGSTNGTPGTPNAPSQGSPSGPDSAACASCTARARVCTRAPPRHSTASSPSGREPPGSWCSTRGGDLRVGTVQGTGAGHHPWFQHLRKVVGMTSASRSERTVGHGPRAGLTFPVEVATHVTAFWCTRAGRCRRW
jgi:hypothetical protein